MAPLNRAPRASGRWECRPEGLEDRHKACGVFGEGERGGGLRFRGNMRRVVTAALRGTIVIVIDSMVTG